ncbi:MAG: hypothetical protein JXM70_00580, partial [Pirellulales bacterium]|nr:hypothetical protein [Pirellulales bacterium]
NAEHKESLAKIKAAADAVGKTVWAGCDGPALRAAGYNFIWIGTVSTVLRNGFSAAVAAINEAKGTKTVRKEPPA